MKRIIYICASFGMLMAVVFLALKQDGLLFLNQIIPILAIFFVTPHCKKKTDFIIITFFSIWVTIYNIVYVILIIISDIDIYNADYRIYLQLIIPVLFALIIRMLKDNIDI